MFKKLALTLVALVLLAVVGTVVAVKLFVTEEKIISSVVPQIEKVLGRDVEVAGAKAMVFPYLGVEISGLKIANTEREGFRNDEPFIGLEKFQLKIEFMPLLKKEITIDEIVLKNADILVEVDREGKFNYDDLAVMPDPNDTTKKEPKEKKEGGEPLFIPIKMNAFIIEDARVRYFDAKGGHSVVLGKINDRTDFIMDGTMNNISTTGELTVTDFSVQTGAVPTPLSGLTLTFNHDIDVDMAAEKVAINAITASFQKIGIKLTGDVTEFNSDPKLNLELNSDKIMIQDIINEIPTSLSPEIAKIAAQGYLALKMGITGAASKPAIDGMLKVAEGKIHYTALPQSINDITASIKFSENDLDIKTFALKLGKNPIELMAKINNFADPSIDAKLDAKLNLDDMREMMSLPDGFTVGGQIDAGLTAKGKVDPARPEALDIKGSVAVKDLKAKTTDFTAPIQVNGKVIFTPSEILEDVTIKVADSDMSIKAALKNYLTLILPDRGGEMTSLTVQLNSNKLNTNGFMAKKEVPADKPAPAEPKSTEPKSPKPILVAPLPNIDLSVVANVGTLMYDQITLTNIASSISLKDQLFKIAGNANLYGGTTTAGFKLNATNLNDLKTAIGFDVSNVQIDKLISSFNDQLEENRPLSKELKKMDGAISGAATFTSTFNTHGRTDEDMTKNLTGKIHANIADGSINGGTVIQAIAGALEKFKVLDGKTIDFRKVRFNAHIADEKLYIDTLDMYSSHVGDWLAYGPVGFDAQMGMTLETRLTKKHSAPLASVSNKGKDAATSLVNKYLGGSVASTVQGQIDKRGIPVDSEGRVTPLWSITGPVSKPKILPKGFKQGDGAPSKETTSPKQDLQAEAKKQAEALKKKAEAELKAQQEKVKREAEAAKKKAEEEARKAAEEAKRKADEAAKQAAEKLKADEAKKKAADEAKKAEEKLKKAIKKPSFKF